MRRHVLPRVLALVLLAGCSAGALGASAHGSLSGSCTAAQKTQRQTVLAAYRTRMVQQRKAYFRRHPSAKLRRAFVAKQQIQLKKLRAAASCTVATPGPPVPSSTPTPIPPAPVAATYEFGGEVSSADQMWPKDVVDYAGRRCSR